jgi:hypothetical protein
VSHAVLDPHSGTSQLTLTEAFDARMAVIETMFFWLALLRCP